MLAGSSVVVLYNSNVPDRLSIDVFFWTDIFTVRLPDPTDGFVITHSGESILHPFEALSVTRNDIVFGEESTYIVSFKFHDTWPLVIDPTDIIKTRSSNALVALNNISPVPFP